MSILHTRAPVSVARLAPASRDCRGFLFAQNLRQLGDIRRDPSNLVFAEQLCRRAASGVRFRGHSEHHDLTASRPLMTVSSTGRRNTTRWSALAMALEQFLH